MRSSSLFLYTVTVLLAGIALFASVSSAATLTIMNKDGVGSYLADDKGMTLYLFTKDSPGKSACGAANGCLEKWPVFRADAEAAGLNPADVAEITRDDGLKQTTYKGQPLYYFFKDKASGDTNGRGVNNVWFTVAP